MNKSKSSIWGWLVVIVVFILVLIIGNVLLFQCGNKDDVLRHKSSTKKSKPHTQESLPRKKTPYSRIAIVIDDLGYEDGQAQKLAEISPNLTLSVLPYLQFSKTIPVQATKNKQDILLHLPMEPFDSSKISSRQAGMMLIKMSQAEISANLKKQLKEFPTAVGVNNHMGSLFTTDEKAMEPVLSELKKHRMFFLDSLTTNKSIVSSVAKKTHTPALRRDIFLDNELERDYILKRLDELVQISKKKGQAIGIGHPHEITLQVLKEFIPTLENKGIRLVKLSSFFKGKEINACSRN